MKKAFRKMLAVLMALTMIVANFAIIAVNAEEGHAHAEEVKCPGVGEEHDISNCDWTKGKTVAPACNKPGYTLYTCNGCKAPFMADIVPADKDAAHVPGEPVTEEATCTEDGSVTVYCTVCTTDGEPTVISVTPILHKGHEWDTENCKCKNCEEVTQDEHTYVVDSITKYPTKDSRGEAKLVCTNCGDEKTTDHVAKMCTEEGHTWTYVPAQQATCQQEGYLGHIWCEDCEEAFCKVVDKKLAHTWDEGEVTKRPTCTEEGEKLFTCTACKTATKTEKVNKIPHDGQVPDDGHRDPTCLTEGWDIYVCTMCNEIVKEETFPKVPHSYDYDGDGDEDADDVAAGIAAGKVTETPVADCTTDGSRTSQCIWCGIKGQKTETLKAPGHTVVKYDAKAPTCTVAGWTEGQYCSVCSGFALDETNAVGATCANGWLKAPEAKAALDHSYTKDFFKPANCTEFSESYKVCVRCDKKDPECEVKYGTTLNPDNHVLGREIITPATCTKPGLDKVWCTLCDKYDQHDEETAPLGHAFDKGVAIEGMGPTCTEKGWTRYTCTRANCDGCVEQGHTHTNACKSYDAQDIPALGHTWGDVTKTDDRTQTVVVPEDCKNNGYVAALCQACGEEATKDTKADKTVYVVLKADAKKHHVHVEERVVEVLREATCILKGLLKYDCEICGKSYTLETADYGKCKNPEKIDPDDYADLFCNAEELANMVIAVCPACGAYYEVVGEGTVEDPEELYVRIYTDKETLPEGETVTLKIHNVVEVEGDPYNCMDSGYDAYEKCTNCSYTTYEYYDAEGHKFMDNGVLNIAEVVEADCDEYGYTVVYCSVCGQLIIVDVVAPYGHSYTPGEDGETITGIFSCKDERLLEALKNEFVAEVLCDECGEPIHNIEYLPLVVACDGVYRTAYCVDGCGYEYIELIVAFEEKLHDDDIDNIAEIVFSLIGADDLDDFYRYFAVEDSVKIKTPANAEHGNEWEAVCRFCGETYTWYDDEIVDELYFDYWFYAANEDFEIFDPIYEEFDGPQPLMQNNVGGYYWDMPVTNGGIVAVVITTNSPGVEVNSIGLKLEYDAERLEFIKGEVTNDKFNLANCRVNGNNKTGDDTYATLTVLAVTEDGNIGLNGEEELAIAYFRVLTQKGDDNADKEIWIDLWDSERSEVLNEDGDDVDFDVESYEEYWIYKLGDLTCDERIGLADINEMALMIDLDYEGDYYTYADINRDGVVDIFDYELLVDYYLEIIDYLELCGQ